jgi:hypothetical protein
MKHLKTFESFSQFKFDNIFESIKIQDRENYILIFNSLYNNHLTINEKIIIESQYGLINENTFWGDLVDKGKRKVLKVATEAGNMLVDLAQKAKDVLDFGKMLANKIGEYVKSQFNTLLDKVKNYALKDTGFVQPLIEFIEKKKQNKLKQSVGQIGKLITYIISGKFITDIINKLTGIFSKVLNMGTNEGLSYLENEFLLEDNGEDKKPFLQRLGEKIMSFPPFSWIPKIHDLLKKGIGFIADLVDRFFSWVQGKEFGGSIQEKYDGSYVKSDFSASFGFLFQILELYIYYKTIGKIEEYKKKLDKAVGFSELTDSIKDKSMDQVWGTIGINGGEISNNIINSAKKVPYVGTILSILDMLVIALGSYLAIKPSIEKITT